MQILLVAVDSKDPNIALGKLSTYHKQKGDKVDYINLGFTSYPTKKRKEINAELYDHVYVSQIFEQNTDKYKVNAKNISFGGVGLNNTKLPEHIDKLEIDYSLFDTDTSYGFITRGCVRNCYFCKVPKHEGKLYKYANITDIVRHKKVKFMDNNILAYDKHMEEFKYLRDNNIRHQFNQGLDIRLITNENAEILSQLNYMGEFIFAFDHIGYEKIISDKLQIIRKHISKDWKMKFYIYHDAEKMNLSETIYRVGYLRDRKILPYVMRDLNCWTSGDKDFLTDYAAYCNQPGIFKKMDFETFMYRRHTNKDRITTTLTKYKEATP